MNFGEIRQAVYDRLDISASDPLMSPDKVGRFVNQAMHEVTMERDWPWLEVETTFNTVAGQQKYPVSTIVTGNFTAIRELVLTSGPGNVYNQVLEEKSRLALDDRFDQIPQNRPTNWAFFGETVLLGPPPDGVYQIVMRYWQDENDMTSDSDTLMMPGQYHHTVADLAAFYCLRRDREDPQAKMSWDSYQAGMKLMVRRHRAVMAPLKIRVRPGGGI